METRDYERLVALAKELEVTPADLRTQIRCVADGLAESAYQGGLYGAIGFLLENEDLLCSEEDTVESVIRSHARRPAEEG